ncbi:hypothetical protein [Planktothricoides raciborskii]|uniref:Uncharacterized protein n=1 Tax=Planktothricoides raciborskii FACHB-1370 TaxID=2949576 RepID=A0ABR8ELU5_9CYAN|nr:hypothetical protein [Planktothricoides raciborskii]MBD2547779.1 hypothetical protein [Planktothricoides raciborskii FACHB-1370]MBD2584459.1 hypothetical protein [Planktothricoides raciborskii FACHB-1261]
MMLHHATDEKDYWFETVQIETVDGDTVEAKTYFLRVYPTSFNGYDAYMDIPKNTPHDPYRFKKVYSPTLKTKWEVISGPHESFLGGAFRGDYDNTQGNPSAWIFGLKNCSN